MRTRHEADPLSRSDIDVYVWFEALVEGREPILDLPVDPKEIQCVHPGAVISVDIPRHIAPFAYGVLYVGRRPVCIARNDSTAQYQMKVAPSLLFAWSLKPDRTHLFQVVTCVAPGQTLESSLADMEERLLASKVVRFSKADQHRLADEMQRKLKALPRKPTKLDGGDQ